MILPIINYKSKLLIFYNSTLAAKSPLLDQTSSPDFNKDAAVDNETLLPLNKTLFSSLAA